MKLNALWILMVFVPALSADPVTTCNAGAASVPVFDVTSVSGAVGDYTLDCTGGNPTPPDQIVPDVTVAVVMNVNVLDTLGWILTDGVTMTSGTMIAPNEVEFSDVP